MITHATYTQARAKLATLCDEVTANRQVVVIRRRGAEDGGPQPGAVRGHFGVSPLPLSLGSASRGSGIDSYDSVDRVHEIQGKVTRV
jgi:hypothetical protein